MSPRATPVPSVVLVVVATVALAATAVHAVLSLPPPWGSAALAGLAAVLVMVLATTFTQLPASLLLLLVAAVLAPANAVRVSEGVTASDVALAFAAAAALLEGRLRGLHLGGRQVLVLTGLGVAALGALASGVVNSDGAGVGLLVRTIPAAAVTCLIVWTLVRSLRTATALALAYATGCLVSTLGGQLLNRVNPVVGRSYGLSVDSNHFAFSCVLGLACAGFVLMRGHSTPARLLATAAGAAALTGTMLSGSRAGALGAMVVLAVLAIPLLRLGVPAVVGVASLAVGTAVLGARLGGGSNALARLFGSTEVGALSAQLSDDSRDVLLRDLLDALQSNVLVGVGWSRIREAHIHLLQVAIGAGVLGIIGYLLVSAGLIASAFHLLRADPRYAALAGGLLAFLAMGLGQNILWDRYVWLVVALGVPVTTWHRATGPSTGGEQPSRPATRPGTDRTGRPTLSHLE